MTEIQKLRRSGSRLATAADMDLPDNSGRPLITGWELWCKGTFFAGEGVGVTYRDPAFPACPRCQSPNLRLLRTKKKHPSSYWCLDCKSRDECVVTGSTGIERRRAQIKMLIIVLAVFAALLALVLTGHGSWLGSGGG